MNRNSVKEMIKRAKQLTEPDKADIYKVIDKVLEDSAIYKALELQIKKAIGEGTNSALLFSDYYEICENIRLRLLDEGYKISMNKLEDSLKSFCEEMDILFGVEQAPFTHETRVKFYVSWE